jgi:hypothetical protein
VDGGVMVAGADGARSWLAAADLAMAVASLESAITIEGNRRPGNARARQILVAGPQLGEWPVRLLTTWAILAGAALVLQPDPALRLGTVRWARPTVFQGSAAEIAALREQVEESRRHRRRWRLSSRRAPRPPFGRLSTLLQREAPDPDNLVFWKEQGVRLLQLPALGDFQAGGTAKLTA